MEKNLLLILKNKINENCRLALYSTFIFGMLTHFYKFSNTLLNHDSLYNFYIDQDMTGSGRWFLSIACGISSYFDLPWINGILSIIYVSLTMLIITKLFRMKNKFVIILSSGIFATFPSLTETLFFGFTADGYMLAMLLATLGVYFSRIDEKRINRYVLSGMCICLACAIYQSYVSFALILAITYFMNELLQDQYSSSEYLSWVKRQIIIFSISLIVYFIIWKTIMYLQGISANNYQGINELGKVNISILFTGLIKSIKDILLFFIQWNILEHGITLYSVLSIIFIIVTIVGIIVSVFKSGIFQKKLNFILFILCLIAFVPFTCIWNFVSYSVLYRPMMLYSLALLYVFVILIYDKWINISLSNLVALFLVAVVFNNSIMANISYYYMHLCNQKTFAESIEMISLIHEIEDSNEFDNIAIVGDLIEEVGLFNQNLNITNSFKGQIHLLSSGLEKSLMYDAQHIYLYLKNVHYLDYELIDDLELQILNNNEEVQKMKSWPSKDSMKVIGGTLVIKLSDIEEE